MGVGNGASSVTGPLTNGKVYKALRTTRSMGILATPSEIVDSEIEKIEAAQRDTHRPMLPSLARPTPTFSPASPAPTPNDGTDEPTVAAKRVANSTMASMCQAGERKAVPKGWRRVLSSWWKEQNQILTDSLNQATSASFDSQRSFNVDASVRARHANPSSEVAVADGCVFAPAQSSCDMHRASYPWSPLRVRTGQPANQRISEGEYQNSRLPAQGDGDGNTRTNGESGRKSGSSKRRNGGRRIADKEVLCATGNERTKVQVWIVGMKTTLACACSSSTPKYGHGRSLRVDEEPYRQGRRSRVSASVGCDGERGSWFVSASAGGSKGLERGEWEREQRQKAGRVRE
ncbi:hypothetical protein PLEOSDRAFT_167701 [Pleurotus ostreatus PC15]|uniref:Uncharacterized protein n=1 Tax=Pleurotus ostreatus (strain PC15) TaxID=1137138 RepID=A0A067NNE0_PLEO1|nr:hypothetical protein PLEOSDRAFT_167701 [Pleurotus ostreatus PC15]